MNLGPPQLDQTCQCHIRPRAVRSRYLRHSLPKWERQDGNAHEQPRDRIGMLTAQVQRQVLFILFNASIAFYIEV